MARLLHPNELLHVSFARNKATTAAGTDAPVQAPALQRPSSCSLRGRRRLHSCSTAPDCLVSSFGGFGVRFSALASQFLLYSTGLLGERTCRQLNFWAAAGSPCLAGQTRSLPLPCRFIACLHPSLL